MFVGNLVEDYWRGKLSSNVMASAGLIVVELVVWLCGGCFFGWAMWGRNRKQA